MTTFNKDAYLNDPLFLLNWACRKHTGVYLPSHYSNNYPNKDEWSYKVGEVVCYGKNKKGEKQTKKIAIRDKNSLMLDFVDRPLASVEPQDGIGENIFKQNLITEMNTIFNYPKVNKHYRYQHIFAPVLKGILDFMEEYDIVEHHWINGVNFAMTPRRYIDKVYNLLYINEDSDWFMPIPMEYIQFLEDKVKQYYRCAVDMNIFKTRANQRVGGTGLEWDGDAGYPFGVYECTTERQFFQQCRGYKKLIHGRDGSSKYFADLSKGENEFVLPFDKVNNFLSKILFECRNLTASNFWWKIMKTKGIREVQEKPRNYKRIRCMLCKDDDDGCGMLNRRCERRDGNQTIRSKWSNHFHAELTQHKIYHVIQDKGKVNYWWQTGGEDGNLSFKENSIEYKEGYDLTCQTGNCEVAKKYWYPYFNLIVGLDKRDASGHRAGIGYHLRVYTNKRKHYWDYIKAVSPKLMDGYLAEREADWKNRSYKNRFINDILTTHKVI